MQKLFRRCLALGIFLGLTAPAMGQLLVVSAPLLAQVESTHGAEAQQRVARWQALMTENANDDELRKLELVNRFINRVPYVSDLKNWGRLDYWATPLELLSSNGGDCEDYAIAKYFSLTAMGVPAARLQITYAISAERNEPHMVLAYLATPGAEPLILDNLRDNITAASQRHDLSPLFGFNSTGVWLAQTRGRGAAAIPAERINLWADLIARMSVEAKQVAALDKELRITTANNAR